MTKNMQNFPGYGDDRRRRGVSTYAVPGLTECEMLIPAGKARLRIHFSGGSLSALGAVPATFTTRDPVVMKLIENSPQFLTGKIRKVLN